MNDRQKAFVTEYIIDFNATQAAIRAGYSERTAYSQGQRLLKNVEVANAIDELRKRIRRDNIAEADEIEEFLSLSMRGEMKEEVVVVEGNYTGGSTARIIDKQIGLRERLKAAELLGKRYALFTDTVDLNASGLVVITDDISTSDDGG